MGEKQGDIVYTPDWCAKDIVSYFKPSGTILDPCCGGGVFLNYLPPGTMWCEIEKGVDFFNFSEKVDWAISNPPYSLTRKWFQHTFTIADQFIYLVPCRNIFSGYGFVKEIYQYGGLKEIRMYGTGAKLGFPMGNAIAAFHGVKYYKGDCKFSFYEDINAIY